MGSRKSGRRRHSRKSYRRRQSRKSYHKRRHTQKPRHYKKRKTRKSTAGMYLFKKRRSPQRARRTSEILAATTPSTTLTREQVEKDIRDMRRARKLEVKSDKAADKAADKAERAVDRFQFNLNWIKSVREAKEKLTEKKLKDMEAKIKEFVATAPANIYDFNRLTSEFEALKKEQESPKRVYALGNSTADEPDKAQIDSDLMDEFDKTPTP